MPVFPGSSSPSQRCSFHFAPFCQAVIQCSISVEVSNPSLLNQAADFFPSETITATLKSFESMSRAVTGSLFPFSPRYLSSQDKSVGLIFCPYFSTKASSSRGFLFFFHMILRFG